MDIEIKDLISYYTREWEKNDKEAESCFDAKKMGYHEGKRELYYNIISDLNGIEMQIRKGFKVV